MHKQGLIPVLVTILISIPFILLAIFLFNNGIPQVGKKQAETGPENYLVYTKSTIEEKYLELVRDGNSDVWKKDIQRDIKLTRVKEDNSNKKVLSTLNNLYTPGQIIFGSRNVVVSGRQDNQEYYFNIFNKDGQDKSILDLFTKNGLDEYSSTISPDSTKIVDIIDSSDSEEPTEVKILDLSTNQTHKFKLDQRYLEDLSYLVFSNDSKRLYLCACYSPFSPTPVQNAWIIDLTDWEINPLDEIKNIGVNGLEFQSNGNYAYVTTYKEFELNPGKENPHGQWRSKQLVKVDLKTFERTEINFENYFGSFDVSPSGKYLIASGISEDADGFNFIKNLYTGEEYKVETGVAGGSWSNNDRLAYIANKDSSEKGQELYIFDPQTREKILVDYFDKQSLIWSEDNRDMVSRRFELVGWIK